MKIIVNGRFLTQRVTGVQRFAREILQELDRLCEDLDIEIAVPRSAVELPNYVNIKVVTIGKRHGTIWEQTSLVNYARKQKGITLNLCNSAPLFGKKIVTIHDVKIKAHPEYFSKKFLVWYSILFRNITKKAQKIITVSEFSKKEIIKYYKVNPDKISVIYNGWQHFEKIGFDEGALEKYGLNKSEFYFSMSSIEPNKNIRWIVNTAQNNSNEIFAVAGGINKSVFVEKKISLPGNVKILGYITDEEAKTLMRDCKAFLFPSIYEGFGIPPLEALSAGTKSIIVSDTEVMHEIFGMSAIYINNSIYDLHLNDLIGQKSNIENLLSVYSWGRSGYLLYSVLSEVVGFDIKSH